MSIQFVAQRCGTEELTGQELHARKRLFGGIELLLAPDSFALFLPDTLENLIRPALFRREFVGGVLIHPLRSVLDDEPLSLLQIFFHSEIIGNNNNRE